MGEMTVVVGDVSRILRRMRLRRSLQRRWRLLSVGGNEVFVGSRVCCLPLGHGPVTAGVNPSTTSSWKRGAIADSPLRAEFVCCRCCCSPRHTSRPHLETVLHQASCGVGADAVQTASRANARCLDGWDAAVEKPDAAAAMEDPGQLTGFAANGAVMSVIGAPGDRAVVCVRHFRAI